MQNAIQQQQQSAQKTEKDQSREQNPKNVHANPTDNCFKATSPLNLVVSTMVYFHKEFSSVCLKYMVLQWYSKYQHKKKGDIFCLKNAYQEKTSKMYIYIGKDEQGKCGNYRSIW